MADAWVTAVEEYTAWAGPAGRVHAYDLERQGVPHPLGVRYAVDTDHRWEDEAPGPRCLHCVEIVGTTTGSTAVS